MYFIIKCSIGPSKRFSTCCISSFTQGLLWWAIFQHADETYELLIDLFEILFVDLFVSNWFPEEKREVKGKVTACPKAAAHEDTDEFEETEMIGAIGFGIDNPFRFMLTRLMSIVRGWNE